jgi:uncharacterized delta-60 repeat protein
MFIARYNPDGTLAWAKRAGGTNYDYGSGITALSDDSLIVTGDFQATATFGYNTPNVTYLVSAGSYDIFVARYNSNGTFAWAKCAGGTGEDEGWAITALSDGSTVATGSFEGSATFGPGEPSPTVLASAGGKDIFIARYNAVGAFIWAKSAGGTGDDGGKAITALSGFYDKDTVVTGNFQGTAVFGKDEPGESALYSAGGADIFIARYNPDGTLIEADSCGGTGDDSGQGITVLSDDSTVVTGYFQLKATFGLGEPNQTDLSSAGGYDIFIAGYSPSQWIAWAKRAGGTNSDIAYAVTALSDDSTVATGWFTGSSTFGPGEPNQTVLTSAGSIDIFIARFYE